MQAPRSEREPLTWLSLQVVATVVLALMMLAIMAVFAVVIPPLVILAVVYFATAYALRRWGATRRAVPLVGAVLALGGIAGNLGPLLADLAHPESALTFVTNALAVVAALVATIAGVAVFVRAPRDLARPVGVGAVVLAAVLVGVSVMAALQLEDDAPEMGDLRIVAQYVEFPESVEAKAGQVAIFVENRDTFRHTFAIKGGAPEVELPASTSRRFVLDLVPGAYSYVCTVAGHEQMEGVLTVVP